MGYTLPCTRRKIMSKISNYILYYPSIEFQSTEWVKSSLLLWDKIYRIVPEGYEPIDNDEIRAFVDAGLIRNIVPTDDEKKSIEKKFKRTCKQLESPQYRPAGLQSSDYDLIHVDKIDKRLYPYLDEITKNIDFSGNEWVRMSKPLARAYMFILSKAMAEFRNMNQGTDNPDVWSVGQYFSNKGNFGDYVRNPNAKSYLCSLVLDDIIPQDIEQVSAYDIISFSTNRQPERELLRSRIDGLMDELTNVRTQEHAYDIVNDFVINVENEKESLKRSMSFRRSTEYGKAIMTGINLSFGAMTALSWTGTPFSIQHLSAAVLFGAVGAYLNHRKVKQTTTSSDVSMLVGIDSLRRTLPINLECMNSLDEFVND